MLTSDKTQQDTIKTEAGSNIFVKPWLDASAVSLLLRLFLGISFFAHGGQKVFGWFGGHGLEGTAGFMASIGIPVFLSYAVSFIEFFGGLALIAGLLTRLSALGLAFTMVGAIVTVHLKDGYFGSELPLALGVIAVAILILGPGKYSLDNKLFNRK